MKDYEKTLDASGIVALRKTELFNRIWYNLANELPESEYKYAIKEKLMITIAKMNNALFLATMEKRRKNIDPNLSLDELKLSDKKIINKLMREIKTKKTS